MYWLIVPIVIWILALLIMGLPRFVGRKLKKVRKELKIEAKLAKHSNPEESMYKSMEEGILEIGNFKTLTLISSIIGLIFMALGTVALCAVLLL